MSKSNKKPLSTVKNIEQYKPKCTFNKTPLICLPIGMALDIRKLIENHCPKNYETNRLIQRLEIEIAYAEKEK